MKIYLDSHRITQHTERELKLNCKFYYEMKTKYQKWNYLSHFTVLNVATHILFEFLSSFTKNFFECNKC